MAIKAPRTTKDGMDSFQTNAAHVMRSKGLNYSEVSRLVDKHHKAPDPPSRKTVNNALTGRHDPKVSTLQAMADGFGIPLWVLFVPGMKPEDLESPLRERLAKLVTDYIECGTDNRAHVESMAAALRAKSQK